ncbi:cation-transporting P-type ATPase [Haloimpatiens sp. FM7315]|uniref:P-type ATPase n=1 Tax=Haloimpatiens sp. FM7315 TaxID=3298609 RepID=UPI0035A3C1CE
MEWYNYTWNYVVKNLKSDSSFGLRDGQVEESREKNGSNKIEKPKAKNLFILFLQQFKNLWLCVLVLTNLFLMYEKSYLLLSLGLLFFIGDMFFLIVHENNKYKGLKEIDKFNYYNVHVLRNGRDLTIASEDVVVGDIVFLCKGNIVPADIRIIKSTGLKVKEGAVTGENYLVEKYETRIEERDIPLSEMKNMLFRSSYVKEGEGFGVVVATGMDSNAGKIFNMLSKKNVEEDFYKQKLSKALNTLSIYFLVFIFLAFAMDCSNKNKFDTVREVYKYLIIIGTFQTFLISINLIYVYTLKKLKKKNIFIKNTSSIYKICDISMVAFEKIGTLSEKTMELKKILINNTVVDVNDVSYEIDEDTKRLFSIGLLCSNSSYNKSTGEGKGELEDIELIKFCNTYNVSKNQLDLAYPRIFEIPFDSERKIKNTINKIEGNYRANIKGSLEYILERCTHIRINGVERQLTKEDVINIKNANISMCGECLNIFAIATRAFSYEPSLNENIESNLVFEGLLAFHNPLNKSYKEELEYYKLNCIKPIIMTKDNKLTAYSLGKKLKLITKIDGVLSGVEVNYMNEEELNNNIAKVNILSNVDSSSKSKIAKALKNIGYNIAMYGNNLKDLAFLNYCKVSIGTGKNCSYTIKKISDVFMEEFNLYNFKEVLKISKAMKLFFDTAFIFVLNAVLCEGTYILGDYLINKTLTLPYYSLFYLNLVGLNLILLALFKQGKYMDYVYQGERINDGSFIRSTHVRSIIYGLATLVITSILKGRFTNYKEQISFIILNLFISIFVFVFSNRYKYVFESKTANFLVLINIFLSFLVFLF